MEGSRAEKKQMEEEALNLSEEPFSEGDKKLADVLNKVMKKGMLAKEALGLNDTVVEGLYAQAYRLYNTGKYVDASYVFRILITLDPTEPKYLLGLGACFHMGKEYQNAIEAYTMCAVIDPQNPVPHYHASDCYLNLGDKISSIVALEMTVKRAGDKPEFAAIKDRARMTIDKLKKEVQENPPKLEEEKE